VLTYRHPGVPNWGDMTRFRGWPDANVSLLVGGTPCQSFSVAGLRKGLDDPRGNLALVYLALADRYRPKWLVWENVPGVLSSNGGRDFGAFLGGLGQLGYGWAYRILDAQYFGVPQRRRRVFVVGHLGGWRAAAAVLLERHSLSGHPALCREARERTTADLAPSLNGRRIELTGETRDRVQPYVLAIRGRGDAHNLEYRRDGTANALLTPNGGRGGIGVGAICHGMTVRRLTPRECERLQGFPDDYTLIPYRGKPAADGPRYKALGNSMAVPVMRWIGLRIAMVSDIIA
jgi:DNA (cytosine-5)-methyltransferase 1